MNLKEPVKNGFVIFIGCVLLFGMILYYFISRAYADGYVLSYRQGATIYNKDYVRITGANLHTDSGDIIINFNNGYATKTISNFIELSKSGFYDGTRFHRVVRNFMIQGGDPFSKGEDVSKYGTGGPGYVFGDEINNLPMIRGVVAMANKGSNTNGSQFFIMTGDKRSIEGKYTIFGYVVEGMENVDAIESAPTSDSRPLYPIGISSIDVFE